MRIQENKKLVILSKQANKTVSQLSGEVFQDLQDHGILKPGLEYWGMTVSECCIDSVVNLSLPMQRLGIPYSEINEMAFGDLVFILDGECPNCGYDMEVVDSESKQTFGNGYDDPEEFVTLWEEKKCLHCGFKTTNEPS